MRKTASLMFVLIAICGMCCFGEETQVATGNRVKLNADDLAAVLGVSVTKYEVVNPKTPKAVYSIWIETYSEKQKEPIIFNFGSRTVIYNKDKSTSEGWVVKAPSKESAAFSLVLPYITCRQNIDAERFNEAGVAVETSFSDKIVLDKTKTVILGIIQIRRTFAEANVSKETERNAQMLENTLAGIKEGEKFYIAVLKIHVSLVSTDAEEQAALKMQPTVRDGKVVCE